MHQLIFLIIPILLFWSWVLPIGFTNRQTEGTLIYVRPIPVLARLKRHALTHSVATAVAIALAILNLASAWWIVVAIASFVAIVSVPQKYIVTTSGIRTGHGNFRRWTEFAGVYRSKAGARLQTISRGPDVPIWLSGDLGDDEFVHLLRTLVRDSYKGKLTTIPLPPMAERPHVDPPEMSGVAAYKQTR